MVGGVEIDSVESIDDMILSQLCASSSTGTLTRVLLHCRDIHGRAFRIERLA